MKENYTQNDVIQKYDNINVNKQLQELNSGLQTQQPMFSLRNHTSSFSSSRAFKDYQKQESEENYVSRGDFNDNSDTIIERKQISRSQLEILLQQSQRQKLNCIQPLNSTIYPKINLHEKQQENSNMEFNQDQYDSNLLQKLYSKQKSTIKSSQDTDSDCAKQDSEQNIFYNKQHNFKKELPYQRNSDEHQSKKFQNQYKKEIVNENKKHSQNQQAQKGGQCELFNSKKVQNSEEINLSQLLLQQRREQLCKETKQIIKKKDEKLWNVFVVRLGIFQRFLRNLKNLSESYKFRMMNADQKQKFNDLSFFQSKQKKFNNSASFQKILLKIFSKFFQKIASKIKIFNPLNFAVICLELVMLVILIAQIFILPLADSFDISYLKDGIFYLIIYTFPVIMFSITILVKLNTGFFKENIVVSDRKQIFLNYYQRGDLFLDFIIVVSFLWTNGFYNYLFLLLKLFQIQNSIVKIDIKFSLSQRFAFSFQISKLILLVLMLAHLNGCIFNQIAKNLEESWLTKNNLQNTDWYERYIDSLYFSFITMATVGYGDIIPISLQERVFVIFMVVYSCGVFGYILSSIGNIFQERAQIKANYKRQLIDIIHYMRIRNIDQILQQKIFQYLHYLEKMEDYNHQKGQQIVEKLSPDLQQQININSYYPFLKNSNYFKLNFKDSILINASLKMKELTFGPGQIIFNQNDLDSKIYFILKGKVQLSINNHNICTKDEDDRCFGISEFFTGESRSLQAKSISVSQILYLELSNFQEVLKEDLLEYEKFCSLRDQIIFSKISVDQSCYFCNKYSHIYDQCPFYTLKNQRLLMIEKSKRNINQLRQKIERRFPFKSNCLQDIEKIKLNLKAVRLNYINKLAFDKNEMIQHIQDNILIQNDIEFYRNNNAFQYKYNEEEQTFSILLLNSNEVCDEFMSEEDEQIENSDSVETFDQIQNNNNKKIGRSSIIGGDIYTEEQQFPSSSIFQNQHNQLKKRNSILPNPIQMQSNNNINSHNSYTGDRLHQQSNTKIQNLYRQASQSSQKSSRRQSNQSYKRNPTSDGSAKKIQDQLLFNQIVEILTQVQAKQEADKSDMQSIFLKNQFFDINNFDQMKNFTRYFPKSNFINIITKYNNLNLKKQRAQLKKDGKSNKIRQALIYSSAFKKSNRPHTSQQIQNTIKLDAKDKIKSNFQIHSSQEIKDAKFNFNIEKQQNITNGFR
ncbi:cyclic nucleotide-binding domain protein (macronuclear) [Tetrahymena thermophila SB210]|uniref:Cyclic nucleotide-binding domain protein n=1 Tax=Tetrahymena thermophila (strain SB210) TaxID=312017 RepID=Q23R01_TETTS|nr:cyclic nucleotide-binding domain protein [Tetrahymena thermophila SB210]EAR98955.2 cyclic nucleotide-binding domain protein [Tetrahymena thermophila SB210]|eukprot:XP_001019200.2 cyclic nucleotide-binding domain protein [Tetrahymena thermophila SB210]